jgi:predicted dienelactone hydrolase
MRAPFPVVELARTYVDESRTTDSPDDAHDAAVRTLVTTIRVPDAPGRFPLVVFAHGFTGHPRKATMLLDAWAAAGYVVAAPAFPLTNQDAPTHVLGDFVHQPADVSAVIDGVLADAAQTEGPLAGRVDPERIGVAGHSLGGATGYGLVGQSCCRDVRVRALVALSAPLLPFSGSETVDTDVPLLALHGTDDEVVPVAAAQAALDAWPGPKRLVTLPGGRHSPPYEDAPSPHDNIVVELTLAFFAEAMRG